MFEVLCGELALRADAKLDTALKGRKTRFCEGSFCAVSFRIPVAYMSALATISTNTF